MKILLLGEYSRLHNSLKEGLEKLGHQVLLVGTGDSFKNLPSDIHVDSKLRKHFFFNKFWQLVFKISGFDYFKKDVYHNLLNILPELQDFDVVQLINEDAFHIYPKDEMRFFKQVFAQNKKIFLSACGEDYHVINYYKSGKMRYSILNPFIENPDLQKEAAFSYKYLNPEYKILHDFVVENVSAIIPSDMDYAIPYARHPKVVEMIPNPVNIDKIAYKPIEIKDKINIFFGINRLSFYKKGSHIVLEVLKRIKREYQDKVHIDLAENLSYNDYIQKYDAAHILIDQLYSYDQGYNALEAMAKGKCVITGAEKEFEQFYKLTEPVAVNALPDADDLYHKLSGLIENKDKILQISRNARRFVTQYHDYKKVARRYLDVWEGEM